MLEGSRNFERKVPRPRRSSTARSITRLQWRRTYVLEVSQRHQIYLIFAQSHYLTSFHSIYHSVYNFLGRSLQRHGLRVMGNRRTSTRRKCKASKPVCLSPHSQGISVPRYAMVKERLKRASYDPKSFSKEKEHILPISSKPSREIALPQNTTEILDLFRIEDLRLYRFTGQQIISITRSLAVIRFDRRD